MLNRVMGLDLGDKTLGIALSDTTRTIASPIETYRFEDKKFDKALERVIYYCEKENIKEIALGYPLHMNGSESEHSLLSKRFKEMIEEKLKDVSVFLIDERGTTIEATNYLLDADMSRKKRKKVVDAIAAQIILETYLARRKRMRLENDKVIFIDDNGNKEELTIYFTYKSKISNKNYIYFYHDDNPDELIAGVIEADGSISDVESEEEYDELDAVLDEYESNDND